MRPANSIDDRPTHEVQVIGAENESPRGLVDGVVCIQVGEERSGQEARDIGVIHQVAGAVTVDFVGVERAVDGVVDDAVCGDGVAELGGEAGHILREGGLGAQRGDDLGGGVEVVGEHHVGGDEELEDGRVVRGPEGGADEARVGLHRVAEAVVFERFGRAGRESGECVWAGVDAAVGGVGGSHHCFGDVHYRFDGVDPLVFAEEGDIPRAGVVVCRDFQECGQRVELVFALEDEFVVACWHDLIIARCGVFGGSDAGFDGRLERVAVR